MYNILIIWSLLALLLRVRGDEDDDETLERFEGETTLELFSEEQLVSMKEGGDEHKFEAEVNRLMEIIIHSLYTDRDIFLRELISNAADALDKIRYRSLTDKSVLGDTPQLEIKVQVDQENNFLSVTDTGVGMTAAELSENLGTVARSGTARFLEAFSANDRDNALNLIGQFGVGFYSSFLVADEVIVVSKSNNDSMQHVWSSTADGQFTVAPDPRGVTLGRGTQVILKLKEDAQEYLDSKEVERIVSRYSMFQTHPIKLLDTKMEKKPVVYDELTEEEKEALEDDDDISVEDEEEEEEKEEFEDVEVTYWKTINEQQPLWLRTPNNIEENEYQTFYKGFAKATDDYLSKVHFKAEGQIEFSSLLFIPKKAPYGLYDNYYTNPSKLSLYVRRVLVADEFEDFLPRYLGFVKGLVDSNDLPLNVNREQLQKNKIMKVISKKLTRKALDMMHKMAEADEEDEDDDEDDDEFSDLDETKEEEKKEGEDDEDEDKDEEDKDDDEDKPSLYSEFWDEFGMSVKLGVIEDTKNRKKLMQLLRFKSTRSPEKPISLQSYVDNMPENQKNIYYISAGSMEEAKKSPFMERVRVKGFEVLYFVDNLDEYLNLADYEDFPLQSITKEGLDLGEGQAAAEWLTEKEEEFRSFTEWLKKLYEPKVTKVSLSNRLEDTPMIIPTTKHGQTANMARIMSGQTMSKGQKSSAMKVVEINFRHPVIKKLKEKVDALEEDEEDTQLEDYANMLYDVALVNSGFMMTPEEVGLFSVRLQKMVRSGLDVAEDAEVEALPEFAEDEEEEEEDEDEDEEEEEEEEVEELEDDNTENVDDKDEL